MNGSLRFKPNACMISCVPVGFDGSPPLSREWWKQAAAFTDCEAAVHVKRGCSQPNGGGTAESCTSSLRLGAECFFVVLI
uniref:hypothetical protein n=1 Tax=Paenibacillus algicola TaxID=2565926 RepID=UPI001C306EE3|nr:hypothetical protein [Paenibacillus algicola]